MSTGHWKGVVQDWCKTHLKSFDSDGILSKIIIEWPLIFLLLFAFGMPHNGQFNFNLLMLEYAPDHFILKYF
jgi:hypothetical protein